MFNVSNTIHWTCKYHDTIGENQYIKNIASPDETKYTGVFHLQRSTFMSTLDLMSGYRQVKLDEDAIPKSAFCTMDGLFEFIRMPFGLKDAYVKYHVLLVIFE